MFKTLLNKILKRNKNEETQISKQNTAIEDAMQIDVLDRLENKKDLTAMPDCYWL